MNKVNTASHSKLATFANHVRLSLYACLFLTTMEWLFLATKPSLLSNLSTTERVSILLSGPVFPALFALPFIVVLYALQLQVKKHFAKETTLGLIPASIIFAVLVFLMLENFTNTMFGFSTADFPGFGRVIYLLIFLGIVCLVFWKLQRLPAADNKTGKAVSVSNVFLLIIYGAGIAAILAPSQRLEHAQIFQRAEKTNLPNIIIFSSDGVNNKNSSAFGYERDTTPFMKSMLKTSLVSVNHFSNAANTTGSVISLLTSKYPTTTRLIYPPDTLTGSDSYAHLPGILQNYGYRNADISIRSYADTLDLNLLEGFQFVNGRSNLGSVSDAIFKPIRQLHQSLGLYLAHGFERVSSRMLHIFHIRNLENPFKTVTVPQHLGSGLDDGRFAQTIDFINVTPSPFFMHVHLMGTHGPRYRPKQKKFSANRKQKTGYMTDFYDDAIQDFDNYIRELVRVLKANGVYENTLLILNSDHSSKPTVGLTVPLLIKFPRNEHAGVIEKNTQRIDIAPTVLDYLGIEIPDWMEGNSLIRSLRGEQDIFITSTVQPKRDEDNIFRVADPQPPYLTLGKLFYVDCDRLFSLNLRATSLTTRNIPGHTRPCPQKDVISKAEALRKLINHLQEREYDTSALTPMLSQLHSGARQSD